MSKCSVVGVEFIGFDLYDEFKNERVPRTRDQLLLVSSDRFATIVDVARTVAQVEPDHVVVDRRFRLDQEAVPTAFCYLPKPQPYLDDAEVRKAEFGALEEGQPTLKSEVQKALLSLQSSNFGPLCSTLRPELQPVDQRALILVANSQYKI